MYSELIFPLNSNDPVLLEIPVIITQGASERIRFPLDDLIYVEACQHRLILHTVQGDFSTRCTFAGLTVCLASTGRFFRNGKGLLINFSHVALVQATGEVLLKNGQTVFCSRRRKRETREAFLAYARTLSRRWLDTPELGKYEAFTNEWHYYLKEKQNEARRTEDDALQQQISMGILKLFYLLPYDTKTDFYAQFAARMEAAGKN